MTRPRIRITIRTLMVAVAVAGWIIFNGRLIGGMIGGEFTPLPAGPAGRVVFFTAVAWLIGPIAGSGVAYAAWTGCMESGKRPAWSGLIAGAIAGFVAWDVATILVCIGHGADGQTPLAGFLMGFVGALVHLVPGLLIGVAWGWRRRHRGGETGQPASP